MTVVKKSLIVIISIILTISMATTMSYSATDDSTEIATLQILAVATGQNYSSQGNNDIALTPDYEKDILYYNAQSTVTGVISRTNIIFIPTNPEAEVEVYITCGQKYTNVAKKLQDLLTGKGLVKGSYAWRGKDVNHFQTLGETNVPHCYRVLVKDNGEEKEYSITVLPCVDDLPAEQALTKIKEHFVNTVLQKTVLTQYSKTAQSIVEAAKISYTKAVQEASTVEEACLLVNQFNKLLVMTIDMDVEMMALNDAVNEANGKLVAINEDVTNSANTAVTDAEALLESDELSDDNKAAVKAELDALRAELQKEDATAQSITAAEKALAGAILDAYKTEKTAVEGELKTAKDNYDDLKAKADELERKNSKLEADLLIAEANYDKADKANKELLKQIEDLTKAKESAEKQLKAVKDELRNVTNLLVDQSIESALDHAESVINTTVKELSDTSATIADNALRKVIETANEAISKATADLSGVLGSNAEAMNKMIERFDGASDRLSKAGERLAEAIATGGTSAREKAELRKQIKEAAAELEKAQKDIETLRADLDKASDDSELKKQIEDLTGELSTAKGELEQTKADLEAAQAELLLATKPAKVDTISAKAGKKKVTVTWSETERAEGFVVYRSLKKKKGYKAVKTIKSGTTLQYTDKKVVQGKKYFYKVRAYKMYDGNKLYGAYSAVKKTGKVH